MKLLLVGFDGLDSRLFEQSGLPAFAKLRVEGQWGTLRSKDQVTGPCWTTIMTGWTTESHGVTHSLGLPYEGSEWIGSRPRDYLWDELGLEGYSVGVMNFPATPFAREIAGGKGWMVGGWPGRPTAWPAKIVLPADLYSDLGDYSERGKLREQRPRGAMPGWAIHEMPWGKYIVWARRNAEKRIEVAKTLPETEVLMFQDPIMDRAGHMLATPNKGKRGASDKNYNQALILAHWILEHLWSHYQPEFLAIVSDHGFQGSDERKVNGPLWHSKYGTWALVGPDVLATRSDTDQVNFAPTLLDALGLKLEQRDGSSVLLRQSDAKIIEDRLADLGYEK